MIVAFDIDGTLIDNSDQPRHDVIDLFRWFESPGHTMAIWSGGGKDYARQKARELNLKALIYMKCSVDVDIAVDDAMETENWGKDHKYKVVIKV